jgi:hypothetical protein
MARCDLSAVLGAPSRSRGAAQRRRPACWPWPSPTVSAPSSVKLSLRMGKPGHRRTVADIDAVREWLSSRDDCTGRIGVIGFCMGAGYALALAAGSAGAPEAVPGYRKWQPGADNAGARRQLPGQCGGGRAGDGRHMQGRHRKRALVVWAKVIDAGPYALTLLARASGAEGPRAGRPLALGPAAAAGE